MCASDFMCVCCWAAPEDEQPSCVLERQAKLALLATPFMRGRQVLFQGSTIRARENGALACVTEWTNILSEGVRLFAHGAGTGVSCTQKGVAV